MDIDDFLDRELSDLGLQEDRAQKSETGSSEIGEGNEQSPFFASIKSNLDKGNLQEAEQAYVQLWSTFTSQKLKWNAELYDQLLVLSKYFSGALTQNYSEIKRKADYIYDLITRARNALKEGKKELPFKLYAEIEEVNNSISNVFFEEKRIIEEQIMDFYKELRNVTNNELVKRVSILIQEIYRLIDKTNIAMRANDITNAIVNYNRCVEFYSQVPEGFLRYKNSLGMRILDIYKNLSIYTEISKLQQQLSQQAGPPQAPPQHFQQTAQNQQSQKPPPPQQSQQPLQPKPSKPEANDAVAKQEQAKIKAPQ